MGKRSSEQKRALVLRRLEDSELTVAEFCRRRGLCYATVARWRRESRSSKSARFVEVEVHGDGRSVDGDHQVSQCAARLRVELSLPGGAVLRLYGSEQSEAEA